MSNITLSSNTTSLSVNATSSTITVSSSPANITVGAAQTVANSAIRNAISNTFPILYDVSSGVISIDSDAIVDETVVNNGTLNGNITLDLGAGRLHNVTLDGDVTGITFANIVSGRSATVVFTQDAIGGNNLDTTTYASNWTNWEFANGYTDLDTTPTNWSVLSVFYDGTNYYSSLVVEQALTIQNSELANSNVTFNGVTVDLGSSGTLTTDDIQETAGNVYSTSARIRGNISVADNGGDGSLGYDNGTGIISYTGPSAAEVRAHFSGGTGINYNSGSGVIALSDTGLISGVTAGLGLNGGGSSGNVTLNVGAGYGINVGASTVAISNTAVQDQANIAIPAYFLDSSNQVDDAFKFNGNLYISGSDPRGIYDGSYTSYLRFRDGDYHTNLHSARSGKIGFAGINASGDHLAIVTGSTESNVIVVEQDGNTTFTGHVITDHLTPANNGNIEVNGNLNVSGNLNYVNVEDLLVNDQSITLNYGNVLQDAFIYVDRTGLNNAHIKWNETSDQWEIYDGTSTYVIPRSTTDLAEGTNLYWTTDRGNTNSDAWLTTKSTTDLAEGTNLYFSNTNLATSSTTHLPEGTNLYYTDSKVDTHLNTGTATTGEVLSWTGSDYDWVAQTGGASYSNANVADYLLDTGIQKKAHTVFVQDLALSPDAANAQLGFYMPNGSGTTGQVLKFDSATQLTQAFLDTGNVTETTNLYYTTDRANSAIEAHTGSIANLTGNVVTTGNITGDYVFATTRFQGDINGAIQNEVWNASGGTLNKGDIVALNGAAHGSTPDVVLADASNASLMPGFGVVKNSISINDTGEVIISGKMNFPNSFTVGAQLYVNGAGQFTETPPPSEANLVQKIAKVVSSTSINVAGAGRTNATPNLDDGNIFLGNGSNESVSAVLDTSIVPENGNLYYTDARVQSNTAADTGLVHTTGTETVGGAKSFTSAMTVSPSVTVGGDITNAEIGIKEFHTPSAAAQMAGGGLLRTTYGRGTEASPVYGKDGDLTFRFIGVGYREGPAATTGGVFGFQQDGGNVSSSMPMAAIFRNAAEYTGFSHTGIDNNNKSNVYLTEGFASKGSTSHVTETLIIGNHDAQQATPTTANLTIGHTDVDETESRSIYLWFAAGSGIQSYFGAYDFTSTGVPPINSDTVCIGMNAMPRHKAGTIDSGSDTTTFAGATWVGDYLADGTAVTINGSPTSNAANADSQTYYTKALAEIDWAFSIKNGLVAYALYTDSALTTPLVWGSGGLNAAGTPGNDGNDYSGWADIQFTGSDFTKKIPTAQTTTTGSGTGAEFFVSKKGTTYTGVGSYTAHLTKYNRVGFGQEPMAKGSGYAVNDTVEIDGSYLGGVSGTNNLTFTIDSVDGGGGVTSTGNVSGTAYDISNSQWQFEKPYTSDTLSVKHNGTEKVSFTTSGVALKQFNETVVALGNQSGNVSANIDAVNGSIFTMTANGNVTIDSIPNSQAGSSYTLKITQDGTGNRLLTSGFKYLGGNATLSTGGGNIDVISVVYDGTDYLASLSHDYK